MNRLCYFILSIFCFFTSFLQAQSEMRLLERYDALNKIQDGMQLVVRDGMFGFVNEEQEEIIAPKYAYANSFSEGLTWVIDMKGNKFFIDKNDKKLFDLAYESAGSFSDGLCKVMISKESHDDYYGYIDTKGNLQVPLLFSWAEPFRNGFAMVREKHNNEYGLINRKGELIFPYKYESITALTKNRFALLSKNHSTLTDEKGKEILSKLPCAFDYDSTTNVLWAKWDYYSKMSPYRLDGTPILKDTFSHFISSPKNGHSIVYKNNKYAFVYKDFKFLTPFKYHWIHLKEVNGKYAVSEKENEYFFIDKNTFERTDTITYESIIVNHDNPNYIAVTKNGFANMIDTKTMQLMFKGEYESLNFPEDKIEEKYLYAARKNGKYGYVNHKCEVVIPCEYEEYPGAKIAKKDKVILKKNYKYGLLNAENQQIIIPFEYEGLSHIDRNGNIVFEVQGSSWSKNIGLLSAKNDTIFEAKYNSIQRRSDEYYWLKKEDLTALADKKGKIISDFYEEINVTGKGYLVKRGNLYGLLDTKMNIIIPLSYKYGSVYKSKIKNSTSRLLGLVALSNEYSYYGVFNEEGKNIAPIGYFAFDEAYHSLIPIINPITRKTGFMDTLGHIKIEAIYSKIAPWGNGFIAQKGGKWGVIDANHKIIHPFIYDDAGRKRCSSNQYMGFEKGEAGFERGNTFVVNPNYRQDLLDENLKFKSNFEYSSLIQDGQYFKACKDGLCGILDENLKVVIPLEYESIEVCKENYIISKAGKVGLMNKDRKIIIAAEYDQLWEQSGYFWPTKNGKRGLIEGNKLIVPCIYDDIRYNLDYPFGFLKVSLDNKYGLIDTKGNAIIPIEFEDNFQQIDTNYISVRKINKYALFDKTGKLILKPEYENINFYNDGQITVTKYGRKGKFQPNGIVQYEGDDILEKYNVFEESSKRSLNGVFAVRRGEKWALQTEQGTMITELIYDNLALSEDQKQWIFTLDEKKGLLNNEGIITKEASNNPTTKPYTAANKIVNHDIKDDETIRYYDYLYQYKKMPVTYCENRIYIRKRGLYGLIDFKGKQIVPPIYDEIGMFYQGVAPAKKGINFGFIDTLGKTVVEFFLEEANNFKNGYAIVKKNGKYGAMNGDLKLAIPFKFDELYSFNKNARLTIGKVNKVDAFMQFVDNQGNIVESSNESTNDYKYPNTEKRYCYESKARSNSNGKYGFFKDYYPYDTARDYCEGRAAVAIAGKYSFVDDEERPISAFLFDEVSDFKYGIALVRRDTWYYFIDKSGKCIAGCEGR